MCINFNLMPWCIDFTDAYSLFFHTLDWYLGGDGPRELFADPPDLLVLRVHLRMVSLRNGDIVNWKNVPMIDIYYIEGKERYHPKFPKISHLCFSARVLMDLDIPACKSEEVHSKQTLHGQRGWYQRNRDWRQTILFRYSPLERGILTSLSFSFSSFCERILTILVSF